MVTLKQIIDGINRLFGQGPVRKSRRRLSKPKTHSSRRTPKRTTRSSSARSAFKKPVGRQGGPARKTRAGRKPAVKSPVKKKRTPTRKKSRTTPSKRAAPGRRSGTGVKKKSVRKSVPSKKRSAKPRPAAPRPKKRPSPNPRRKPSPPASAKSSVGTPVGEITHYFSKIMVCVLRVDRQGLRLGDRIRVSGKGIDFIQPVESMQVESRDVAAAKRGQLVGLKVIRPVKPGCRVGKVG